MKFEKLTPAVATKNETAPRPKIPAVSLAHVAAALFESVNPRLVCHRTPLVGQAA